MPSIPREGARAHQRLLVAMAVEEGVLLFRGLEFQVELALYRVEL